MYVTAVFLAAGKGQRFKSRVSKPLSRIGNRPIFIYSLKALSLYPDIKDIVVVANGSNKKGITEAIKKYRIPKIKDVILGGNRRQDSVINGLKATGLRADFVLIHDAARPFIDRKIISSLIKEARKTGAAIAGVQVKATIKKVQSGHIVEKTIDRKGLWEIQTPQVFKRDLIFRAYGKFGDTSVTDDAMLVEKLGARIGVVEGSYNNIKITTPEDLVIARAILKKREG